MSYTHILPPRAKIVQAQDMLYKPKDALKIKVLQNVRLVPENYEEDVRHIVLDLSNTNYVYTEGQSMGVLPPGVDEKGRPHKLRLYSIASPSGGDPGYPNTVSLCVKRVVYKNERGEVVRGVCSNYLCDLKEGDEVLVTGPAGKHFVLPEDAETDLLFFATGTGIAPFRAFLFRLFTQQNSYKGKVYLFFGSRYRKDHLYANDINNDLLKFKKKNFVLYSALSRENPNKKVYVNHILEEHREEVETVFKKNNYIVYICGLKGMEGPIINFMKSYYEKTHSLNLSEDQWSEFFNQLSRQNRLIVETY